MRAWRPGFLPFLFLLRFLSVVLLLPFLPSGVGRGSAMPAVHRAAPFAPRRADPGVTKSAHNAHDTARKLPFRGWNVLCRPPTFASRARFA
jgi:hypothetical protein